MMEDKDYLSQELTKEEAQLLYNGIHSMNAHLESVGELHPNIIGPAILSMATFIVETIYRCSKDVEAANLLLAAAQDAGLQSWIDYVESARIRDEDGPQIVTLDS